MTTTTIYLDVEVPAGNDVLELAQVMANLLSAHYGLEVGAEVDGALIVANPDGPKFPATLV